MGKKQSNPQRIPSLALLSYLHCGGGEVVSVGRCAVSDGRSCFRATCDFVSRDLHVQNNPKMLRLVSLKSRYLATVSFTRNAFLADSQPDNSIFSPPAADFITLHTDGIVGAND